MYIFGRFYLCMYLCDSSDVCWFVVVGWGYIKLFFFGLEVEWLFFGVYKKWIYIYRYILLKLLED